MIDENVTVNTDINTAIESVSAAPARSLNDIDLTGYDQIDVFGAREHNLKNIDVSIPRNKRVVVTGISGMVNRRWQR